MQIKWAIVMGEYFLLIDNIIPIEMFLVRLVVRLESPSFATLSLGFVMNNTWTCCEVLVIYLSSFSAEELRPPSCVDVN